VFEDYVIMNNELSAPADRSAVDVSLLLLRVIVGVIFIAHGAQKMFGVWDGPGLTAFVEKMGGGPIPYLVAIGEFFGGVGLVFGFLTRFSAASLIVIMIGAIVHVHGKNGFFSSDGGFEYNIALIGLLLPIFICGPGRISIGRLFLPKSAKTGRPVVVLE
jgi:putative oxidoreductase